MPDREASRWVRKAENDPLAADNNLGSERVPYDVVCFHCQQAGEKLLKTLLVDPGVPVPRTHDLMALLQAVRSVQNWLAVRAPSLFGK